MKRFVKYLFIILFLIIFSIPKVNAQVQSSNSVCDVTSPPSTLTAAIVDDGLDDTAAIQACINYVQSNGGGIVYFPKGTYTCESQLTIPSDVTLDGQGNISKLDFSTMPISTTFITASGTSETSINITQDIAEGDSLIYAPTSTLVAGDYVRISSNGLFSTQTNQAKGEIKKISNIVDGNSFKIYGKLFDSYAVADESKVEKLNLVSNISLKDLTVEGSGVGMQQWGFHADTGKDINLDNVEFTNIDRAGTLLSDVLDANIKDCNFYNILDTEYGYGIDVANASQNIKVMGGYAENVSDGFATGGGEIRPGVPRNISVIGFHVNGYYRNGLNAHPGADWIIFSNNVIEGGNVAVGMGDGIAINCNRVSVTNNLIRNTPRHGIYISPASLVKTQINITGNQIYNSSNIGILLLASSYSSNFGNIEINNNTINKTAAQGIYISSSQTFKLTNVEINDNTVNDSSGISMYINKVDNAIIEGNQLSLPPATIGIHLSDVTKSNINGNTIKSNLTGIGINVAASLEGSSSDLNIEGNMCDSLAIGIQLSNNAQYCLIHGNNTRTCTSKIIMGTGAGNQLGLNIN